MMQKIVELSPLRMSDGNILHHHEGDDVALLEIRAPPFVLELRWRDRAFQIHRLFHVMIRTHDLLRHRMPGAKGCHGIVHGHGKFCRQNI